jgi:hypothetical protein
MRGAHSHVITPISPRMAIMTRASDQRYGIGVCALTKPLKLDKNTASRITAKTSRNTSAAYHSSANTTFH